MNDTCVPSLHDVRSNQEGVTMTRQQRLEQVKLQVDEAYGVLMSYVDQYGDPDNLTYAIELVTEAYEIVERTYADEY